MCDIENILISGWTLISRASPHVPHSILLPGIGSCVVVEADVALEKGSFTVVVVATKPTWKAGIITLNPTRMQELHEQLSLKRMRQGFTIQGNDTTKYVHRCIDARVCMGDDTGRNFYTFEGELCIEVPPTKPVSHPRLSSIVISGLTLSIAVAHQGSVRYVNWNAEMTSVLQAYVTDTGVGGIGIVSTRNTSTKEVFAIGRPKPKLSITQDKVHYSGARSKYGQLTAGLGRSIRSMMESEVYGSMFLQRVFEKYGQV